MNNVTLAGLFVTSPVNAFNELRERPRFLFPLIALAIATAALTGWYYSVVDFAWLNDAIFSSNARMQAMSEADRAKAMSMMSQKSMMSMGIIGTVIVLPLIFALQAGYFALAGKITGVQQSFMHWFSLLCWSNLPALAATIATMLVLMTQASPAQVHMTDLQVLSLNELFFQRQFGAPGYTLLSSLSLVNIWTWGLCIVGVRTWSNRSWTFSSVFVLLPFVVIYGTWAFFAFKG